MIPPRKFLLTVVLIALGNFQLSLAESKKSEEIAPIIQEADGLGAPFTAVGLTRLQSKAFGKSRATRTTDVIIHNKSSKLFRLVKNECEWGGFSKKFFPEHVLAEQSSTVFGIESNGVMAGVECGLEYRSNDLVSWFSLIVGNPYIGKNDIQQFSSSNIQILHTRGTGGSISQTRFVIDDA